MRSEGCQDPALGSGSCHLPAPGGDSEAGRGARAGSRCALTGGGGRGGRSPRILCGQLGASSPRLGAETGMRLSILIWSSPWGPILRGLLCGLLDRLLETETDFLRVRPGLPGLVTADSGSDLGCLLWIAGRSSVFIRIVLAIVRPSVCSSLLDTLGKYLTDLCRDVIEELSIV